MYTWAYFPHLGYFFLFFIKKIKVVHVLNIWIFLLQYAPVCVLKMFRNSKYITYRLDWWKCFVCLILGLVFKTPKITYYNITINFSSPTYSWVHFLKRLTRQLVDRAINGTSRDIQVSDYISPLPKTARYLYFTWQLMHRLADY